MADYQSTLAAQAGKTVQTTDGYTVTYDANGYALQSVSPDGQTKYYDSLGNETSTPRQEVPAASTQPVTSADANYAAGETADDAYQNNEFGQPANNNLVSSEVADAQSASESELEPTEQATLEANDPFSGTVTVYASGDDELIEPEEEDPWVEDDGLYVLDEDRADQEQADEELVELTASDEDLSLYSSGDSGSTLGGTSTGTPGASTTSVTTNQLPKYSPLPNPLSEFPSYTYGLSLFLLDPKEEFNKLIVDPKSVTGFKNCLIASAGRFNSESGTHKRNAAFKDDFYFDGFKMTTMVGLNEKSKASNAIEFSFNIVEPYGLTLLNRIIDAAKLVNAKNYLQMPYMIQLDFFGYDDNGLPLPESTTSKFRKRFPVKLIEMKARVGVKGSEYAFRAVPFNHQAFQETAAATPISMTVTAGTIGDFFGSIANDEATASQLDDRNRAQQTINDAQPGMVDDTYDPDLNTNSRGANQTNAAQILAKPLKVTSYATAFNLFNEDLKANKNKKTIDKIEFVIDPDIAKSIIVWPSKDSKIGNKALMATDAKSAAAVQKGAGADPKLAGFSISAGTSVMSVIDLVFRCSEYYLGQFLDPNDNVDKQKVLERKKPGEPLDYFKVIPQIKLNEFDDVTGRWSKTTTYHIVKHTVYDTKSDLGPRAKPPGAVKEYNYIYTGKNTEIIDFQIDFNTAYYTAVTVDTARFKNSTGGPSQIPDSNKDDGMAKTANTAGPQPEVKHHQATSVQSTVGVDVNNNPKTQIGADIQKNIYSNSRGDMINLKLKIIGDPHFIKQDDVWTNPSQSSYAQQVSGQIIQENQSIVFDRGEIFAMVNFKTPVDIDETTGLVRKDSKYSSSVFSGYYRVLTVDNEFRNGKFEQTLDLIRSFNQDGPVAQAGNSNGNANVGGNTGAVARSDGMQTIGDQPGDYEQYVGQDSEVIGDQPGDYEQYPGQDSDTADQEGDYEQYAGQESGGEMYGWESQDTEFGADRNSNLISGEITSTQGINNTSDEMWSTDETDTAVGIEDSDKAEYRELSKVTVESEQIEIDF